MNYRELLGFISAIFIGISLGLIGGGGSILTLPVLVYLLHINPVLATAYSLFVVGMTSLVGSLKYMQQSLVQYKTAIFFAIPSLLAVYVTRKYLMPIIPDPLFSVFGSEINKSMAIMLFFALLMLAVSYNMIFGKNEINSTSTENLKYNYLMITLEGCLVGILTGIVGAGGGFLIIPALVLFAKLPMKMAVGTSLIIITIKSLMGFLGDISNYYIDWKFLLPFTGLSILGIFIGFYFSKFVSGEKLKKSFGWLVFVMGLTIILKELF